MNGNFVLGASDSAAGSSQLLWAFSLLHAEGPAAFSSDSTQTFITSSAHSLYNLQLPLYFKVSATSA